MSGNTILGCGFGSDGRGSGVRCPAAGTRSASELDFVVRHHSGRLDDDATVLPAEWRAGHQHRLVP
ncbi:hypothetical protein [Streptomyces sp. NPDC050759]|uniref:hypothetical protein n=1 Tax=Streptomyces sp. NPDC050759 TaxID=3365635 RepID=UPI0037B9A474